MICCYVYHVGTEVTVLILYILGFLTVDDPTGSSYEKRSLGDYEFMLECFYLVTRKSDVVLEQCVVVIA